MDNFTITFTLTLLYITLYQAHNPMTEIQRKTLIRQIMNIVFLLCWNLYGKPDSYMVNRIGQI
jgi:hypothetical protein